MNMLNGNYALLDWDTDFFGFPVAMIQLNDMTAAHLENILLSLRKHGVRLVYWASGGENRLSYDEIQKLNGLLVDQKTTFCLKKKNDDFLSDHSCLVEEGADDQAFLNLDALAEQCGQFSRFAMDPNIPRDKSIELYRLWIEKSFAKEMADAVFIVKTDFKLNGLITLKKNELSRAGEIGLLVVDMASRNRNIGTHLVRKGLWWLRQSKILVVRVVTQGANETACRFYEKCAFVKERTVNFYHFWI